MEQQQEESKNQIQTERKLTAFGAWSLAFGGIIGFGAFVMPATTFLKRAGLLGSLIGIEIGALIMLIISYGYGYMAKKVPISGGQFIYAERAFGKTHGFICAWFLGLCYISIIPMDATALCLVLRALYGNIFQFGFHYTIAGYDVYLGELLVAIAVLIIFAFIASRGVHIAAVVQTIMVIVMLGGVLMVLGGAFLSPDAKISNFHPLFYPDSRGPFFQIISIVVIAPWLFVGFDIIPQVAEEAKFSHNRVKTIMDTSIVAGCFVYIAMSFIVASVVPEIFPDWVTYIDSINFLSSSGGYNSITTLYSAYRILGAVGLSLMGLAAVCAVLTGVLCFYIASSRLLHSMAREELISPWFGVLNKNGVPRNAVLFCMVVSISIVLLGRHVISWTVDMASIGGAIGYGYTSLAAYKFSRLENRKDVAIFGMLGFVLSVIFAVLLLVPIPGLDSSLSLPSYFMLIAWIVIGLWD